MADPFVRMCQSLFARIGEEAFLRTTDPVRVSVEHGVEIAGEYGEVAGYRTVAEIFYQGIARPKKGDALVITSGSSAGTYALDTPLKDDGYTAKWLVL